jgi:hypothetical protein
MFTREQIQRFLLATLPAVDPTMRMDAGESMAMARQLEFFFAKVYEFEYPDSMGRRLVPVDTSVPTGARAHTYRMFEDVGQAELITSYADDLPLVEATGKEYATPIVSFGAGYFISIQELRSAAMMGVAIDARKAKTVRDVMERKLDSLIAIGDAKVGMTGFSNNAGVSLVGGLTGSWANPATSTDNIQKDFEKIAQTVFNNTLGIHGNPENGSKLTVALATSQYSALASRRLDTYNMITMLEYIKAHNPFIADIVPWARLSTADAGGTGPRVVCFHKDPDVIETVIPQDFEMLAPQPRSLGYSVPCHMRWGGVVIRRPKAIVYADGC